MSRRVGLRVLVIGSGGREHAIAWKLKQSPMVRELLIAPGNGGTGEIGENVEVSAEDIDGLLQLAIGRRVDLTIVGPEIPLIGGIVDRFQDAGLKIFGPSRDAARIEGSKAWAKELMQRHGIPTASARRFDDAGSAVAYARTLEEASYVLKADGPAAGKGVVLPSTHDEAESVIRDMIDEGLFGRSGSTVLVEDRTSGPEVSVFAFVDGPTVSPEIAACDYKRAYDGDEGPNTGGVGAYSPPEMWTDDLALRVRRDIIEPTAAALVDEGCPYMGVLYTGLMLTRNGPSVIEFNCRLGDPEAQVILPMLDADLAEICMAAAENRFDPSAVNWTKSCAAGVVMTSSGYPGPYKTGSVISGVPDAEKSALVFHAGTKFDGNNLLTSGGRVLMCVGLGDDIQTARSLAYEAVSRVEFEGAFHRKDIAARAAKV